MEQTFYVIQYNDLYGDGTDKSIEGLINSKDDFEKWLEQHNEQRVSEGNNEDDEDEFDLIPVTLTTFYKPL